MFILPRITRNVHSCYSKKRRAAALCRARHRIFALNCPCRFSQLHESCLESCRPSRRNFPSPLCGSSHCRERQRAPQPVPERAVRGAEEWRGYRSASDLPRHGGFKAAPWTPLETGERRPCGGRAALQNPAQRLRPWNLLSRAFVASCKGVPPLISLPKGWPL